MFLLWLNTGRHRWVAVVALLVMLLSTVPCPAQITIQGVYVDTKGVLRHRKVVAGRQSFRRVRTQDPSVCYISLPKLFAQVRKLVAAGDPIPQRMRFLDGMVRLQHVFVLPDEKDLIIAGPAEAWDAGNPLRPRGTRTGRPVLQLDDLVVALRHLGPGSRNRAFGCTLMQDDQAIERVKAYQSKLRPVPASQQKRLALGLKEAIGPLTAKFFGVPADTRFAFVTIEADYLMKRLSLGLDRAPVRGMKSYLDRSTGTSPFNRFWFTANYEPLLVAEDGTSFEIPGPGLRLLASDSPTKPGTNNPASRKFADDFTRHMTRLEEAIPCFADLHNLADLAVLAALIAEDKLHEKVGWDVSWVLDAAGYRVAQVQAPRQAETLVNFQNRGRTTVTVSGGVEVSVAKVVTNRKSPKSKDVGSLKPQAIDKKLWSLRRKQTIIRPVNRGSRNR